MQKQEAENFQEYYEKNRDLRRNERDRVVKERQFAQLMREGRVSVVLDWKKVLYGSFGLAFLAKGIMILLR